MMGSKPTDREEILRIFRHLFARPVQWACGIRLERQQEARDLYEFTFDYGTRS